MENRQHEIALAFFLVALCFGADQTNKLQQNIASRDLPCRFFHLDEVKGQLSNEHLRKMLMEMENNPDHTIFLLRSPQMITASLEWQSLLLSLAKRDLLCIVAIDECQLLCLLVRIDFLGDGLWIVRNLSWIRWHYY